MLFSVFMLALRSIQRNLLRSFLTVLGIVIGVSAVITMVTLGNGATAAIRTQISSLGSNLLMVRPGQRLGPGVFDARGDGLLDERPGDTYPGAVDAGAGLGQHGQGLFVLDLDAGAIEHGEGRGMQPLAGFLKRKPAEKFVVEKAEVLDQRFLLVHFF